jgi:hypothetical protein
VQDIPEEQALRRELTDLLQLSALS